MSACIQLTLQASPRWIRGRRRHQGAMQIPGWPAPLGAPAYIIQRKAHDPADEAPDRLHACYCLLRRRQGSYCQLGKAWTEVACSRANLCALHAFSSHSNRVRRTLAQTCLPYPPRPAFARHPPRHLTAFHLGQPGREVCTPKLSATKKIDSGP
ncbi:hypothetical protein CALCODRAFT_92891 [Calocera cornea HHB12733]|uniref:Uncharacterized protein n=1 Tax=Calocera cornea HHB12733 TaxID=1353952 RepID=A0A165D924_9BASI|nr:hypothetical protein CALCODRAFT_92891 [Calocera cornea HHB12733]